MNYHRRFISEEAGPDVHVILVFDQAGWHIAKQLVVPENISLLYLPAYSLEQYYAGNVLLNMQHDMD